MVVNCRMRNVNHGQKLGSLYTSSLGRHVVRMDPGDYHLLRQPANESEVIMPCHLFAPIVRLTLPLADSQELKCLLFAAN